jgi:type II secretory pathway pseudopilin PulG
MSSIDKTQRGYSRMTASRSQEQGFTLIETAVALVIMMVIGLGAASLFAYATMANSGATDRELAMAVAQKRMEWLRTMPFSVTTRNLAYSYPNGGLGATTGTTETETSSGRPYTIVTIIENTSVVPAGQLDAGQPTLKTITIRVTPKGAGPALGGVSLSSQRSTLVPGTY